MTTYSVDLSGRPVALPVNNPEQPGPLWVDVRPSLRRIHVFAGDLLAALGKNRDVAGKGRNESEDVGHAIAWLVAHAVTELVVVNAQRLHPLILRSVMNLAAAADVPLWLLHRPPRTDQFLRVLTRRDAAERPFVDVPVPAEASGSAEAAPPETALPGVPADDFTTFRATCQRLLPAAQSQLVESRFADRARHCSDTLANGGATRETIATLVYQIVNPAPADAELTVDLRALQVAAWHHDLYVKIDLPRLLNSEERPRLCPTASDRTLAAYRQPYRALTVAVTRAGHGVADIAAMTIGDAAPDSSAVTCSGHPVRLGPHASRALRAQLHLRHAVGAASDDPLLPHTPKALAKALNEAATDLGVHVYGRRAERTRNHTESALGALGVTVARLP